MASNKSKKAFPYENILFYFSVIVLLSVAGCYFYLAYASQKLEAEGTALDATLTKKKTTEQKRLEQDVLSNQQRMTDFPVLLSSHKTGSEFFRKLEALTHPYIIFNMAKVSPIMGTATVGGTADSFESLAQQLQIFDGAEGFAKNIDLSKIALNNEGRVDFTFTIDLDPAVLAF
jgi:hypothetical protein